MDYIEKIQKIKNLKADVASFSAGKKAIQNGVFVGENVIIESNVFFDTALGAIVLGDETQIKAGAVLRGPLLIGKNCKLGGEIEHTIFEDYSNKQHYGYVGYSYIGSWVNIGGGTSIATLKNNYGTIKVQGQDTGEQFLGALLGDYVKTAINTSIFCGKVIGVSSHLYGTVTEDVPAFTSYVAPGRMFELPLDIAKRTQSAMMQRREKKFTEVESKLFDKIFEETAPDREKVGVKKEKLSFK